VSRAKRFANLYINSLSIITISNIELEQTKSIINRDIMQLEQSIRERYEIIPIFINEDPNPERSALLL
jgi:hypothetical protein